MTSFEQLLRSVAEARVHFIVVGGIAGGLHGAARTTYDLDIVYARDTPRLQEAALTRICCRIRLK